MGASGAMMLAVAVVAWGTLATAAWAHSMAPRRFADLLAMHIVDPARAKVAAGMALAAEVVVTLGALVGFFLQIRVLVVASGLAGLVLGAAYVVWVTRLVLSDSGLPCACSFSSAPPTWWSVARAGVICGFGGFIVAPTLSEVGLAASVALFVAGLALGTAIYALPEAISWPASAVALKRQVVSARTASVGSRK